MNDRILRALVVGGSLFVLAGVSAPGQTNLAIAGVLHVDLRATNGTAGAATWLNAGSLGHFTRGGNPTNVNNVEGTGIPGVFFNGSTDYYLGPASVPDLEGASDRSVEVWVYNPSIADEETLVSWSRRGGPEGSNLSINYGSNVGAAGYGAIGHWGGSYDLGWPDAPRVPGAGQWHHIVYTYDGNRTASVYVDGALRVSKVLPAALNTHAGFSVNLGTQRSDASTLTSTLRLSGYLNTVRVHGGCLSAAEVANNYAYGPALVPPSGPVAITRQPQDASASEGGQAVFSLIAEGALPITYQWYRDGALLPGGTNRTLTVGPVTVADQGAGFHCVAANVSDGTPYTATSAVARLTVLTIAETLRHRYNFASNANDLISGAHGTLVGASLSGGQVVFGGGSAYVDLPDNLVTGYTSVTFETWVMNGGSGNWARVWDFGNAAGVNMFLTWPSGSSTLRVAYNQGSGEQLVDAALPANNVMHHIVWTQDAASRTARLYVDGVLAGESTGFTLTPAAIGVTANDWLGRSQYSADPYFIGRIDEFRIYNMALPASAVAANYEAGPDLPPRDGPVLIHTQPANASVVENTPASFRAALSGRPPYAVQWEVNGVLVPGATNLVLSYVPTLAENGAVVRLWATNTVQGTNYFAVSSNAVLEVTPDTTAPRVVRASGAGASAFEVLFSEGVRAATATNLAHYTLTGPAGPVALTGAVLNADGRSVLIFCGPLVFSQVYTAVVSQVQDLAATPNTLAPNTAAAFVATPFRLRDIGGPATASAVAASGGGYDITAGGAGLGGVSDQFTLGFESRTGDFDLAVRVSAVTLSDVWARGGLMARAGLETNDAFAAVWATPGPAGCFFQGRPAGSTNAATAGAFPVNHPYTWLRLRRAGQQFEGFASLDGRVWHFLGARQVAMPETVQVGYAVCANSDTAPATASFRDFAPASGTIVTNAPLPFEPLAPCTRKTGLVFSEIMYNPPDGWATNSLEYVELHNPDLFEEDLGGFRLAGDIAFTFPAGVTLPPGGYVVVARDPAAAEAFYGITGVFGPFTNNLPNEGGTLRLINSVGGVVLEVNYNDKAPWPVAADGAGHSLVLRRASYGEADPRAWGVSDVIGGSPGRADGWGPEPLRAVVINEYLANSDPPLADFVELYNASNETVDLSGAWLSDDPSAPKYQIAAGTTLGPRGFLSFTETELGFALSSDGDEIFLWNPARTRVLEALRFGGQAANVSRGRTPDGSPLWSELAAPTAGALNSPALERPVVINEIMYHPISGSNEDEYVELFNRSASAVDVGGWQLAGGINYTFPSNVVIPAGGYLVVAENRTNLLARYPQLNAANTVGDYQGALANGGERLTLEMPLVTLRTNAQGGIRTNISYITVNEVTYGDGGRWGRWSDGGGSSLELVDPRADTRFAANWADSDESQKAPWTVVDFTALLDLGMGSGNGTPDRFEILMQDAGECLVDDLECVSAANPAVNRVLNGGFEGGATNWNFVGTHRPSFIEDGAGVGGTKALHVVAVDRGDPGPNKIWTRIATLPTSQNGTIRAKMRWLKGARHCLLRVRGQWLEAPVVMNVPANPGTPGLPNSRRVANAGPAIAGTTHAPVLPAAQQPFVVSARVTDPDGVGAVRLRYRLDPGASYTEVLMRDDGTGGDTLAGDGIYSATIPGQPDNALVAFYIEAEDAAAAPAASRFPGDAPARECLAHVGETEYPGPMGTYRFWLTQANLDAWTLREWNSNEPLDATFAWGNHRVIYNVGALYSASPWHTRGQPYTGPLGSTACDYELNFPSDDRFLGWQDFVLAAQESYVTFFNNDLTCQAEYTCYWMGRQLGLTYNHKRVVRGVLNGQRRGMAFFDHQQPNGEYVDEYFPDDNAGQLFKIEDWFEFDDAGVNFDVQTCRLLNHVTTGGAKKTARYRYNFRPRAVTGSPNEFEPLFQLVDAVFSPTPEPYTSATLAHMDVDQWMRVFALQHAVGNWDSYGYRRGKNCYTYKPERGPWRLVLWDMELVLGKSSDGPTHNLFDLGSNGAADQYEPTLAAMYAYPPFVRSFWRAMHELVHGAMTRDRYWPVMQKRFEALVENGMPVENPSSLATWIDARRNFILQQLTLNASNVFNVAGASDLQTTNAAITLTGTAPVTAERIVVNGNAYPITWTTVTAWRMTVPLRPGLQSLEIAALDRSGAVLSNRTITVNAAIPEVSPVGWVVFNEIMYNPIEPRTSYVEIFNVATNRTFDLSGWRIEGLGFTFPPGTLLTNNQYLVVARDRFAYALHYGALKLVAGEFPAELDNGGETLSLIRPGATPAEDLVVDRVRYDNDPPWPATADGQGYALQLVDPAQDNSRVANWSDGQGWRFYTTTGSSGTSTGSRLSLYMDTTGGDVYLDDVSLVMLTGTNAGINVLRNGDFELPLGTNTVLGTNNWITNAVTSSSEVVTNVQRTGNACLHFVFRPAGAQLTHFYQDFAPVIPAQTLCRLSFWYLPGTNGTNLTVRFSSAFNKRALVAPPAPATPGTTNSVASVVPPFPPLWLNEVQPENVNGPADAAGEREPWIELYNAGTETLSLAGCYLADQYTNLTQWAFPPDAVIAPGQCLVVVADGEPGESTPAEAHTSFRLAPGRGAVALARIVEGVPQLLDYLNYDVPAGLSYGALPDGQPFYRQLLHSPTPGATNADVVAPVQVVINEWLALNNSGLADGCTSAFEDWFELYNPTDTPADLAGLYLTDDLGNPFQFEIPPGYVVPPRGFLLVRADNAPACNQPGDPDLHVNFRLAGGGESIALLARDGTVIDAVTFGAQTPDVSQGRYPDGAEAFHFMVTPTPRQPNVIAGPPEGPTLGDAGYSAQNGGVFAFSFPTRAGLSYRVEYKEDLAAPNWTLEGIYPGTGGVVVVTAPVPGVSQRFYRVVIAP